MMELISVVGLVFYFAKFAYILGQKYIFYKVQIDINLINVNCLILVKLSFQYKQFYKKSKQI